MTGEASDLADVFSSAVWALVRNYVICEGTVKGRDEQAITVDVALDDTDAVFFGVPLKVLTDDAAPADLELPIIGADVLLGFRDGNLQRPQVLVIHQADIRKMNYTLFEFNGGTLGGLVKAKELKLQSNKDKDILQAIIDVATGPTITEPGNGAPSALQIALAQALAGKTPGTWDNLENPLITQ
jgi:hypothetical protein